MKRFFIILLFCSNLHATITIVTGQHVMAKTASCTVSGCTATLAGNTTAGNTLISCAINASDSTHTIAITMTGETWTTGSGYPVNLVNAITTKHYCWYAKNIAGGQTVVTFTPNATITLESTVIELHSTNSGAFAEDGSAVTGTCASSCTNTLAASSGVTPASASLNDFIFGYMHYTGGTASTTCTANNSFTSLDCNLAASTRESTIYFISSDTSSHTPSETIGGSAPSGWTVQSQTMQEPASATNAAFEVGGFLVGP